MAKQQVDSGEIAMNLLREAINAGRLKVVAGVATYEEHWYQVEDLQGGGSLRVECSFPLAEFACRQIAR